jgi:hypothetical protein
VSNTNFAQSKNSESNLPKSQLSVPIQRIDKIVYVDQTKATVCYKTLVSDRLQAIEEEKKKSRLARLTSSSNPEAITPEPGEYLPIQNFTVKDVCNDELIKNFKESKYIVHYTYKNREYKAVLDFYPTDEVIIDEDGTAVNKVIK